MTLASYLSVVPPPNPLPAALTPAGGQAAAAGSVGGPAGGGGGYGGEERLSADSLTDSFGVTALGVAAMALGDDDDEDGYDEKRDFNCNRNSKPMFNYENDSD